MPIREIIKGDVGSAEIERLNTAYDDVLRKLDLVDRDDPVTKVIGEKVVEVGTSGVTDPSEIAEIVVKHFLKTLR